MTTTTSAASTSASSAPLSSSAIGPSAGFSESSRCYLSIRTLLELWREHPHASQWLSDALDAEELEMMMGWLKAASKTAALGRAVEKAPGVWNKVGLARRRSTTYERTEAQEDDLAHLKAICKAISGGGRRGDARASRR